MLRSVSSFLRAGASSAAMRAAAVSTLNRLIEVVSVNTSSSWRAPTQGANWLPRRCGRSTQPALFQEVIRSCAHSCCTTCATRAAVALGARPSELPSR
ncbi:hypothetical protein D3C71_1818030 [compost metagenome]